MPPTARLALASLSALVGGALLIAGGAKGGLGLYGFLLALLANYVPSPYDVLVSMIMAFLGFLASLGGISVLAGGLLIYFGRLTSGKFLVRLGSGTGVLGYLILLLLKGLGGLEAFRAFLVSAASSMSWLGITFSVACLLLAKKPKPKPEPRPKGTSEEGERTVKRLLRP